MTEPALRGVCVVGSINLDVATRLDRLPVPGETLAGEAVGRFPGGKGFNQAIAALRSGAPTRFCGALGDDADGGFLRTVAVDAGLDVAHLAALAGETTGVAYVFALPGGENSIVVVPGANAVLHPDAATAAVAGAGVVLVQLEVPVAVADAALTAGRHAGAVTILNAAPGTPAAAGLLDRVDVLVVNEAESEALGGPERCLRAGAGAVLVTLGARGCELHRDGLRPLHFAAFPAAAVDTTGAGDAFCGALAAALEQGAGLQLAITRAAAAGAITVAAVGAQTDRLSAAAIDRIVVG